MASVRTNMREFKRQVKEYGKRLDEKGIKRAAVDLSVRAENAVKRDFTMFLDQGTSVGAPGGTAKVGHLRAEVHAVVKSETSFGVGSSLPYARPHELGVGAYRIFPKTKKALAWGKITGKTAKGQITREFVRKSVLHPGQRARHWMSIPMFTELNAYIADQIKILESPL